MNFEELSKPFPQEDVEWRLQSAGYKQNSQEIWALCLVYVTNRAIQKRLDEVCGPMNWRNEFVASPCGGVMCGISIWCDTKKEWVTKFDGAENTDFEAVKGGLSGSMKRAAVQWGIGRYLYNLEATYAQITSQGRFRGSFPKDKKKPKGDKVFFKWNPPNLPKWALPASTASTASAASNNVSCETNTVEDPDKPIVDEINYSEQPSSDSETTYETISLKEAAKIHQVLIDNGLDAGPLVNYFNIERVEDLPATHLELCLEKIDKHIEKQQEYGR